MSSTAVFSKRTLVVGTQNYSSWSLRPWILVRTLGLSVDSVVVPVAGKGQPGSVVAASHSPSRLVPALHEPDGFIVWDSLAIAEYLAERHPEAGVWPADARARAHARCASAEMHSGFTELRGGLSMNIKKRLEGGSRLVVGGVASDLARLYTLWDDARKTYGEPAGGPFLYGAFCAADAFFAPVAFRLLTYNVLPPAGSRAAAYVATLLKLDGMREWETAALAEGDGKAIAHYDAASTAAGGPDRAPADATMAAFIARLEDAARTA